MSETIDGRIAEAETDAAVAEVDASRAEASAEAAAEAAALTTAAAAIVAARAEDDAAITVANYEQELAECRALITGVTQSQAALSSEMAAIQASLATLLLTQQSPEPPPESQENPPPEPSEPEAPAEAEESREAEAEEPTPPERKRAHRWI